MKKIAMFILSVLIILIPYYLGTINFFEINPVVCILIFLFVSALATLRSALSLPRDFINENN